MSRIVITRSNPVDPDSRVEKEANSLKKAGHEVILLTWDRGDAFRYKTDVKQLPDAEVSRIRIGAKAEYGAGMKSLLPFIKFQALLFWWLVTNRSRYDICHLCDFDTAFFGSMAARLCHKKTVFDLFDYMSTNANTLKKRIVKKLEDHTINKADAVIICTEQRREQIKDTHPKSITVIHNSPSQIRIDRHVCKSSSSRIKVVYVGILEERRRLKEIAEVIQDMPEVEFHVGGFGQLDGYFTELSNKCDNIFYYGRIPYEDTLALESECDIITAIYDLSIGNSYYAAPNKFYESLMLGKPTIMVRGTGMSQYVEEYNFGELIECTKEGIGEGLERLVQRRSEWPDMAARMKKIYSDEFSWEEMEKRLVGLYNRMKGIRG